MKTTRTIDIHHVTRVEGHGNIKIRIQDGKLEEARWEVVETPRFFEAMLVGKKWENAPWISGRICGICSIGHTLASIRAVENAFGIVPTEQTRTLRLLLKHMETLQSHILHLYFLAAPDFRGRRERVPAHQFTSRCGAARRAHEAARERPLRLRRRPAHAPHQDRGRRIHHGAG